MTFNKEHAIIAQNSATVAAALVGPGATFQQFADIRQQVFEGTLALAGAETVVRAFESPTSVADAVREEAYQGGGYSAPAAVPAYGGGGASSAPNASMELKFGKYRGRTLADVYSNTPIDGRSGEAEGKGWLEWAAENSNNDYAKSKIREFLAAAA